jgi:hypothetical protein
MRQTDRYATNWQICDELTDMRQTDKYATNCGDNLRCGIRQTEEETNHERSKKLSEKLVWAPEKYYTDNSQRVVVKYTQNIHREMGENFKYISLRFVRYYVYQGLGNELSIFSIRCPKVTINVSVGCATLSIKISVRCPKVSINFTVRCTKASMKSTWDIRIYR